jgi:3-phenylpropionate/trans-cinnamate dioxygenase ferredoxin reductase component
LYIDDKYLIYPNKKLVSFSSSDFKDCSGWIGYNKSIKSAGRLGMKDYQYLILGAGMTADAAVRGIRDIDPHGSIGLVGSEQDPPYDRPPLSKGLWKGKPIEKIWRRTEDFKVTLHLGRTVISLDAAQRRLLDDQGEVYTGEKLLLATGGAPRRLPFGGDQIIYYRTLVDYQQLAQLSANCQDFAVIGGGFIGSELAAALTMNGKHVSLLFPDDGIGARPFPHDLSQFLNGYYRDKGVEVLAGEKVTGLEVVKGRKVLHTQSGREVEADGVVAGIGIQPNIELAKQAGLQTGRGVQVDEYLLTSQPNVYAAGDVAEFFNPALGKRVRVEHEDNANMMGRTAGHNMAGANEPYLHLPFFYSDLFDLGYEAVGELDSRLEMVADWEEPFKKGVIYYLSDERVRGVLLWNVWNKVSSARQLIAEPGPFKLADTAQMKSLLAI